MIKLRIDMYKDNGTWYTQEVIEIDKNLKSFHVNYLKEIKEKIGYIIFDGFIVIDAVGDTQEFYKGLYRSEDIMKA